MVSDLRCSVCGEEYHGFREHKCSKIACEKCRVREATMVWTGDSGILGFAHGMGQNWCEYCVVKEQLKHAKEMASKIPELEKRLEELE